MKYFFILLILPFTILKSFAQLEEDISKFVNNDVKIYRTFGEGKSQGLDISIKYLDTWKKEEGNRPHIIQKFSKQIGTLTIGYSILIIKFDESDVSDEDKRDVLENINELKPKDAKTYKK
jgi:hypothetical protein